MTYQELLKNCTEELQAVGVPDPESDARLLLEESAGKDYSHLLIDMREQVPEIVLEKLSGFIAMRKKRIPLQQIIGYTEFMGLKFYVNSDVLCPRQDTEVLVEQVLKRITEGAKILDLCTGSGCIAISIAKLAGASVTATDISEKALAVAERNARENGVCVHFYKGDLYQALPSDEKYDIIVSNPPYIRTDVIETLETEVKDFEPRIALDGTADGLAFYRRIIAGADEYLKPGGLIFFEIGYDQGADVSVLLAGSGFSDISVIKDYGGNDRVVTATLKR
ncbi:MAG TPA: peptide chain release factor N(5)-glutamine methyltransferase [Lachnospiraceae bacterium]|nr:peptide chain release factor N(5)-glutamine methyltransferase [Lachnospiraceae bacterium]MDY4164288.1 peptide chain release factor N(5)-glutamine methyltransferase [Lachnospiraceae bacterium]HAP03148.1 peptide chain release factor N(5)-glutamine methyltransferase [Lachnospiraceae bacterium]